MSDDLRERVARAIYDHSWMYDRTKPWTIAPENEKRMCYAMADAALAEIGGVRVKPLVWTAKGYAQTPFGKYLVVREDWSGQEDFWFVCFAGKPYGKCGEHSSEEAAKAAAQADYEARILAAIEPAPVSVREAARVLCGSAETPFLEPASAITKELRNHGYLVPVRIIHKALRAIAEGKNDD